MSGPLAFHPRATRLASFLAIAVASGVARAEDPPVAPSPTEEAEARAEQIERHASKGLAAYRKGNHDEALLRMERLAKLDPGNPLPKRVRAGVLARTGKYAEALEAVAANAAENPDDRPTEALRLDLLRRLGRHAEAEQVCDAALAARPGDLVARTVKALLLENRGNRADALAQYDRVVEAYNRTDPRSEELPFVAIAAVRATRLSPNPADDMLQGAARVLKRRIDADPEDVDALLVYADLLQSNRGSDSQSKAGKYYEQVLSKNPEIAEARLGLARVAMVFGADMRAAEICRRALESDPSLVPAMNLLAQVHVGDGDYEKADEYWERARTTNPRDKEARATRAARLFITGDRSGAEAMWKELVADDPFYGRAYAIAADLVGTRQRRYDVAATLAEKAVALDPTDDQAVVAHGVTLMNLGREDEARAVFEMAKAAAKDYADVTRDNYREVLRVLSDFRASKSPNFVLKQSVIESEVMETYLLPLLEDARATLGKKYAYLPDGPVLVESFHLHDDLSARALGVLNLPVLGVCFGKVILLDGPFARGLGECSWARTAWHEYAHVVTLGLSKGQVPRWLTEGLSVHEERSRKPEWGRDMERELHSRWRNGRLLKMSEINHAFRGPDVMFAYYQGGLIADLLAETVGFDAIRRMLVRYADDVPTEKVFAEVLATTLPEFDRRLEERVKSMVGSYRMVPVWDDLSKKAFEERVRKDPRDAEAWLRLAWALHQRGNRIDSGAALEKAKAVVPGDPEVVLLEAERARASGLSGLAKTLYEKFLAAGGEDLGARMALAAFAKKEPDQVGKAIEHLEAADRCFPRAVGPGSPVMELSRIYQALGKTDLVVAQWEKYARLAPEDYRVRSELAKVYESRGDDASLLRVLHEMVEIHPFGANRSDTPDLELHRRYAQALARALRFDEAMREWRVQTLVLEKAKPDERPKAAVVEARVERGRILLAKGRAEDALDEALAAVAADPDSKDAQELKRRALDAGGLK